MSQPTVQIAMEAKLDILTIQDRVGQTPPPKWILRMQEQYVKTGTISTQDLRQLLGDPTKRVEIGPKPSLAAFTGH